MKHKDLLILNFITLFLFIFAGVHAIQYKKEVNGLNYQVEAFKDENKGLRDQFYIAESNRAKERDEHEEQLFLKDDVIKQLKARLESESAR